MSLLPKLAGQALCPSTWPALVATRTAASIKHMQMLAFVELYSGQPLAGDLIRLLDDAGFSLWGVYNPVYSPTYGPTQSDLLFENRAANAAVGPALQGP